MTHLCEPTREEFAARAELAAPSPSPPEPGCLDAGRLDAGRLGRLEPPLGKDATR